MSVSEKKDEKIGEIQIDEKIKKRNEIICELGFWNSILSLIVLLFGKEPLILCVFSLFCVMLGAKTKKRKKAVATFVIAIMTVLAIIIKQTFFK